MGTVFTVYKTTNVTNGKYYLGVHKTSSPNDDYLGSGKLLKRAIAKHGRGNFKKEVLFVFETQVEAYAKERELVTTFPEDPLSYNLLVGGNGGFEYINKNGLCNRGDNSSKGAEKLRELWKDPIFRLKLLAGNRVRATNRVQASKRTGKLNIVKAHQAWTGQHHTKESCELMSSSRPGGKNNQWGKKWMYDPKQLKAFSVYSNEISEKIKQGWVLGRVPKHLNICVVCHNEFKASRSNAKCCSRACYLASGLASEAGKRGRHNQKVKKLKLLNVEPVL